MRRALAFLAMLLLSAGVLSSATVRVSRTGDTVEIPGPLIIKGPSPWVDVRAFGCVGDNSFDNASCIQAAVEFAKTGGQFSSTTGVDVKLPSGRYKVCLPIVLPRTGNNPFTNVVHLVGDGYRVSTINGNCATFPTGHAVIEWEAVANRAWNQRISDLSIQLPTVDNTYGIWYKPTIVPTTVDESVSERIEIVIENVLIEAANQYNPRAIWLQGNVKNSTIHNYWMDPSITNWVYDTVAIETDTDDFGAFASDSSGFWNGYISHVQTNPRRGGRSQLFKGRMVSSTMEQAICDGGKDKPSFEFTNSTNSTLIGLGTEGRGEKPQYKFTNSSWLRVINITVGRADDDGMGTGNGIELINSSDNYFDTRWSASGQAWSLAGKKFLTLDSNSKRNSFYNIATDVQSSTDPTVEITDGGTDNEIILTKVNTAFGGIKRWRMSSGGPPIEVAKAFADGATAPSVSVGGSIFKTANSAPTTISSLPNGVEGQRILLWFNDANTTVDFTGTTLKGNNGADYTAASGDAMLCTFDATNWHCTVSTISRFAKANLPSLTAYSDQNNSFTVAQTITLAGFAAALTLDSTTAGQASPDLIFSPGDAGVNVRMQAGGTGTLNVADNSDTTRFQFAPNATTENKNFTLFDGKVVEQTANAAQWIHWQASELLTLSTVGATTDTTANLLPANSIIEAVVARITTTITTATDWKLGDATQAARFTAANATMTAGTTTVGLNQADPTVATANLGPVQVAAAKVRVTTTGTPGAGVIRITVFYRQFVAPTS